MESNVNSMEDFLFSYCPQNIHYTSVEEFMQISDALNLAQQDGEGLFHTRNMVVQMYSDWMQNEQVEVGGITQRTDKFWDLSTAMQSVTAVIDHYKFKVGAPV